MNKKIDLLVYFSIIFSYWIVVLLGLVGGWIVWLMICFDNGLLVCWFAGLLIGFFVGLLVCWV